MDNFKCKSIPQDIIGKRKRLIVIGDIHADYNQLVRIFMNLKLIDSNKKWIATPTDTCIIQVGDQLDGGGRFYNETNGEIQILDFLEDIHEQAIIYGGGVYSLIGNHELMNVLGNFSYVSKKDIDSTGGEKYRKELFLPGGVIANRLSCTRNVVLKVGSFLFVHAGILPHTLSENKDRTSMIKFLNGLMRDFLQGKIKRDNSNINKYFTNSNSILWNREYGKKIDKKETCDKLDKVLNYFSVNGMIIGHSPQQQINSKCNDKLWRVDVGLSDCFNIDNKSQVLEIIDDKKFNIINIE